MAYDSIAKSYIKFMVESKDAPLYVYHGGTYTGGEYNPYRVGERGNLRPMGSGIYAGDTEAHASRYVKHGGESATIHKFEVHPDAKVFPLNGAAWKQETPEMQSFWREKSQAIQQSFKDAGLHPNDKRHWADTLAWSTSTPERETMRKILLKHGVDGAKQVFSDQPGGTEYAFYNTNVLKHIE